MWVCSWPLEAHKQNIGQSSPQVLTDDGDKRTMLTVVL